MARFLLWNIGKRNLDLRVQSLVREHRIDVLLLIEYEQRRREATCLTCFSRMAWQNEVHRKSSACLGG